MSVVSLPRKPMQECAAAYEVPPSLSSLPTVRGARLFVCINREEQEDFVVRDLSRIEMGAQSESAVKFIPIVGQDVVDRALEKSKAQETSDHFALRMRPDLQARFARLDKIKNEQQVAKERGAKQEADKKALLAKRKDTINRAKKMNLSWIITRSRPFYSLISKYFDQKSFGSIRINDNRVEINPWFFSLKEKKEIMEACLKEKYGYSEFSTPNHFM